MDTILTNSPSPIRVDKRYINVIFSKFSPEIQTSSDTIDLDDTYHSKKTAVSWISESSANISVTHPANDESLGFCEAVKQRRSIQLSVISRRVSESNLETDLESKERLSNWKAEDVQLQRQMDISIQKSKRQHHLDSDELNKAILKQKNKVIDAEFGRDREIQNIDQQAAAQNPNVRVSCNHKVVEIKKIEKNLTNRDIQTKHQLSEGLKLPNDQSQKSTDSLREVEKRRFLEQQKEHEKLRIPKQTQISQTQAAHDNIPELNRLNEAQRALSNNPAFNNSIQTQGYRTNNPEFNNSNQRQGYRANNPEFNNSNQTQGYRANNPELNESWQVQGTCANYSELKKQGHTQSSLIQLNQAQGARVNHLLLNKTNEVQDIGGNEIMMISMSDEFKLSALLVDEFIGLKQKYETRTAEIRSALSLLIGQFSGDHTDNELYHQVDKMCNFMNGRVEVPMFTDIRRKVRINANNETDWRLALAILFQLIIEECETRHFETWERARNLSKALSTILSMKDGAALDFLRYFSYFCPLLIPYDPPKEKYKSVSGYCRATGRFQDGTFGHPSERINGIIHIYISVLLVRPHNRVQKSALLSPDRLWRMLAGLFRQPHLLRETNPFANEVILRVIGCAGATLDKIYDVQFKKLVEAGLKSLAFSKEPPQGRPWSSSSLERILRNALEDNFLEAPLV